MVNVSHDVRRFGAPAAAAVAEGQRLVEADEAAVRVARLHHPAHDRMVLRAARETEERVLVGKKSDRTQRKGESLPDVVPPIARRPLQFRQHRIPPPRQLDHRERPAELRRADELGRRLADQRRAGKIGRAHRSPRK